MLKLHSLIDLLCGAQSYSLLFKLTKGQHYDERFTTGPAHSLGFPGERLNREN